MATTVGVRELKNNTSRLVREVREEGAEYIVTYRGEPVAVLRPISKDDARRIRTAQRAEALEDLDVLAEEVSAAWTADASPCGRPPGSAGEAAEV